MKLTNKVILLISPDSWSNVFISKHNYAVELARRGNVVFFLSPIEHKLKRGQILIEPSGYDNLFIIRYEPVFPLMLKFKAPFLFQWLMKWQARQIVKKIDQKIDIVWDFNPHPLFADLRVFGASVNILHPVDKIMHKVNSRGAHIVFSLSQEILDMVNCAEVPKVFINHGLSGSYVKLLAKEASNHRKNGQVKVCYVGNLMIHSIDHELLLSIVQQHKNIQFHFIGPYENSENPLGRAISEKSEAFVTFLKQQPNVILHGTVKSSDVAERLKEFDVFIVCYMQSKYFSNDNSHKILEYLSTGKVVVSTYIKQYAEEDFMVMSPKDENEVFKSLFAQVISNIRLYNNDALAAKRIAYALENTYEKQIERIEQNLQQSLF